MSSTYTEQRGHNFRYIEQIQTHSLQQVTRTMTTEISKKSCNSIAVYEGRRIHNTDMHLYLLKCYCLLLSRWL